jgi:hypothetical protein
MLGIKIAGGSSMLARLLYLRLLMTASVLCCVLSDARASDACDQVKDSWSTGGSKWQGTLSGFAVGEQVSLRGMTLGGYGGLRLVTGDGDSIDSKPIPYTLFALGYTITGSRGDTTLSLRSWSTGDDVRFDISASCTPAASQ